MTLNIINVQYFLAQHIVQLWNVYSNHKDKIKFIKDDLSKQSSDDILRSLESIQVNICNARFTIYGHIS